MMKAWLPGWNCKRIWLSAVSRQPTVYAIADAVTLYSAGTGVMPFGGVLVGVPPAVAAFLRPNRRRMTT